MEEEESDRQQWQRIFRTLTNIVHSQQSQIETLASDRQFLERYIHLQHNKWLAKTALLQSQILQMEKAEKKQRRVQTAKLDVMVGLRQQEALLFKKQYEQAESDLDDFHACLEGLVVEVAELQDKLNAEGTDTPNTGVGDAALELRKLKHSYKKLTMEKDSEVSALLREKDFVWNQLKRMEDDYSGLIKAKRTEVQQVNEALEKLQADMEYFQSSVKEKSETIARLDYEKEKLELDVRRHKLEAEKANEKTKMLQHDVEKLNLLIKKKDGVTEKLRSKVSKIEKDRTVSNRKSRSRNSASQGDSKSAPVTPLGSQPRREQHRRGSGVHIFRSRDNNRRTNASADVSEPLISTAVSALQQCSKEMQKRPVSPVENPRLFSSSFKVPRLKSQVPGPSNLTN